MTNKQKGWHPVVKESLGYHPDDNDEEVIEDWKHRSTQVCKPCWELKYCPYGPFVEQSPLLPPLRSESEAHIQRLKEILNSGVIGELTVLTDERQQELQEILELSRDQPNLFASIIASDIELEQQFADEVEKGGMIWDVLAPPDVSIEHYQVPAPLDFSEDEDNTELPELEMTEDLQKAIEMEITRIKEALNAGVEDTRRPLDEPRRKAFAIKVEEFNSQNHPDSIPKEVEWMECNVFGHICPIVFVGESMTETTEQRRSGRYIPFKTKMRVVRRDNYTCQSCGKHLLDDELEFDHIIPFSKGGSSEEQNLRLACFDCNRSKSDKIEI